MFCYSLFKSPSTEIIQENQRIKQKFLKLDATKKKLLVRQLSSNERVNLLKIIQNNGEVYLSQDTRIQLNQKIKKATHLTIDITRKHDARSMIAWLKQGLSNFAANIAYFFNFLTCDKANSLIKAALLKQEPKVDDKPSISSAKLKNLLAEASSRAQPGEKVNVAKILKDNGFSREIREQTFTSDFSLKNIDLEGLTFTDCKFDWTPCSNSNLKNVAFKSCDIYNLSLMNSSLENCIFDNCDMREVMFTGAKLEGISFYRSSLVSSSFEDTSLTDCIFQNVSLPGTHFFEASIKDSAILNSNLKDTLFFETFNQFQIDFKTEKTAIVTRPTTAILVHPEARGITTPKAYMKLDQSAGTIPIRITMQAQRATKEGVNQEVEAALAKVGPYDKNKAPIPQRLIAELAAHPDFESAKILSKAEKLASQVDSIFLPGGEDVPPALYGQTAGEQTDWGGDYRRSILELGLIHQSFTKSVPLMAVCRGFQISNVYFGAQLIQHIDGHNGIQTLELSTPEKKGLYGTAMKHSIISASAHHQAVPETTAATEHLQSAICYQGLVKAVELSYAGTVPMILLQFHPEYYQAETADSMIGEGIDKALNLTISAEQEAFWGILSDSAKAHRTKKAILQQIPKVAALKKSALTQQRTALEKIEDKGAKVFNVYKKDYFNWKKGLLQVVENSPEKLLGRYLSLPAAGAPDLFFNEREALHAALRYDANFLQSLLNKKNRENILKIIQEADLQLYKSLQDAGKIELSLL